MGRYAIVSDIHGNIMALEAVVNDIQKRNVDQVINLGDHISGPLWPWETIRFLMKQEWIQIAGNHDRNLVLQSPDDLGASDKYALHFLGEDERNWLINLPQEIITKEGFRLFHGTPSDNNRYLCETVENGRVRLATHSEISDRLDTRSSKLIICGHSHIQRIVESPDRTLIINPGSVGCPAFDDNSPEYHIVESGSPHARYSIVEYNDGVDSAELISVSYDFRLAAKRAGENNRCDWETALRTGYFVLNNAGPHMADSFCV